jgi:hypothetical protein
MTHENARAAARTPEAVPIVISLDPLARDEEAPGGADGGGFEHRQRHRARQPVLRQGSPRLFRGPAAANGTRWPPHRGAGLHRAGAGGLAYDFGRRQRGNDQALARSDPGCPASRGWRDSRTRRGGVAATVCTERRRRRACRARPENVERRSAGRYAARAGLDECPARRRGTHVMPDT